MGYGGSMSGGSSRPSNVSLQDWKKLMEAQDEMCHDLIALYIRVMGAVFVIVCVAMTIASFIWGSGMEV